MSIFKTSYWLHWQRWLWKPKCIRCGGSRRREEE